MIKAYTAAMIMSNDSKFLCLNHVKMNNIVFPGGKVDDGELIYDNLIKECREEIGIEIQKARLFNTYVHDVKHNTGEVAEWAGFFYVVDRYIGEPRIMEPDKHRGIVWMLPNDFLNQKKPKYPESKAILELLQNNI